MASSMVCSGKRTSRKRTFAEEENWFLVQYEDQPDTFRVLNQREVKHLDPEDCEEMQEGETVMAFWSADKEFYEAQIIKISDDKSELLKERRCLETSLRKSAVGRALASNQSAKSTNKRSKTSQQQPSTKAAVTDEEKAKKEAIKKAKELEKVEAEKKRNAEIAARIAQANTRISSQILQIQCDDAHQSKQQTPPQATKNSTHQLQQNDSIHQPTELEHQKDNSIHPLSLPAFRKQSLSTAEKSSTSNKKQPANRKQKTPLAAKSSTRPSQLPHNASPACQSELDHQEDTIHPLSLPAFRNQTLSKPLPSTASKTARRAPHRQKDDAKKTCIGDSSITSLVVSDDDEIDEGVITISCDNEDCKALLLENKSLKDKLKKLQRRLDIAVKAKSPTSIMAGKPAAGIVDRELAAEYQMKEFFEGSGVFWYSSQRSICSACTKWEEYVNLVVDVFFSKEVLRMSCARGLARGRKLHETVPLCQPIVDAIIGKVCARFQPPPTVAQITLKINNKCTEARRPKRLPVHMSTAE